jgi:hypothetical protein
LMLHTINLSPIKSSSTPPTSIKLLRSMPEAEFGFLQLIMLLHDTILRGL